MIYYSSHWKKTFNVQNEEELQKQVEDFLMPRMDVRQPYNEKYEAGYRDIFYPRTWDKGDQIEANFSITQMPRMMTPIISKDKRTFKCQCDYLLTSYNRTRKITISKHKMTTSLTMTVIKIEGE